MSHHQAFFCYGGCVSIHIWSISGCVYPVSNLQITQSRVIGRPTSSSLHSNNSKYRSLRLYQYLANKGDQSSNSSNDQQLSKLEDALTNIRSQLTDCEIWVDRLRQWWYEWWMIWRKKIENLNPSNYLSTNIHVCIFHV